MVKRVLLVVLGVVVAGVVALVVYVQVVREDAPDRLTFTDEADGGEGASDATSATTAAPVAVDGTWTVADGTEVGYRVLETFAGGLQESEAAGRTTAVTGSLTIEGTTVTDAEFVADLTTVESDDPGRDRQFDGRIMDTATFPEATFVLTAPIELAAVPAPGEEITAGATGDLTLRGVTNEVDVEVAAKIVDDHVEVLGEIPVVFADYDIPNPSNPFVTTRDEGTLEFLLVLTPASG